MSKVLYGSENFATTLNVGGGINNSQTTGIILTSISGLDTNGGVLGIDWSTSIDVTTYEEIEYGGITGNELTGVVRGLNGFSAKTHNNGAVIAAVVSKTHISRLSDKLSGRDSAAIQDPNGNTILQSNYVASAVNALQVTNAATGNPPAIVPVGSDTNIDIQVGGKGTGKFVRTSAVNDSIYDNGNSGTSITIDWSKGSTQKLTLTGNCTLSFSNVKAGDYLTLILIQDGTGSRTVTWPSGTKHGAGTAPTLTTTASATDMVGLRAFSASVFYDVGVVTNLS